jgi:hypothetical protein
MRRFAWKIRSAYEQRFAATLQAARVERMELRSNLVLLLSCMLYPLWLGAGAADYICHRLTDMEHTSGVRESLLHVAQFSVLACALLATLSLEMTAVVFTLVAVLVIIHTVLAYIDVRYTQDRRPILPFEQQVHGWMDVIPLIAVGLIAVLHWERISAGFSWTGIELQRPMLSAAQFWLLFGSFLVLSGGAVFEELLRNWRASLTSALPPSGRTPRPEPRTQ